MHVCVWPPLLRRRWCPQEAISRSPVYSHLSTSLEGLAVLRAFGLEERFLRQFYNYQDTNTRIYIMFLYMSRWYAAHACNETPARHKARPPYEVH